MNYSYKPLFISKNFCEDFHPVGSQVRVFIDALTDFGVNPTIYAKAIENSNKVVNKYDVQLINEIPHRYTEAIIRRIFPDLILLPDIERFTYLPYLKRKIKSNELENFGYDWIHTISYPCSNHLAGLALKKKYKIPWVAHFYDPWVDNCYRNFKTDFVREYDKKLEADVALYADVIIHTNEIIKDKWIERYGELVSKKIFVLPICYHKNSNLVLNSKLSSVDNKYSILYVGGLYLDRNLNSIINALNILRSEIKNLEDLLIFKIVGDCSNEIKESVRRNNLENLFCFIGSKPHNELSEFYNDADVLLVIDAPSKENIFFPSKLIEYLMYNRPILGITPNKGVTHEILNESGHTAIDNCNEQEIADYFKKILFNNKEIQNFNKEYYKTFAIDSFMGNFMRMLEDKLSKNNFRI